MPAKRSKSHSKPSPAGRTARANAGSAPQDQRLGQLQRLIELMVEKDVVEVELEDGGTRWRVRRTDPAAVTYATAPGLAMAPMAMPMAGGMGHAMGHAMGQGHAPAGHAPGGSHGGGAAEPQGEVFKSPMLGTFYRAASPEAEPFVKAGDRVSADRTLCIIEAMKVMNEIKAEREFEIVEVLVKNGEPVEYGQPLFVIR